MNRLWSVGPGRARAGFGWRRAGLTGVAAACLFVPAAPTRASDCDTAGLQAGELAGVSFEEVVRGSSRDAPIVVAFHYSGGTAREAFEQYDQLAGPVRIVAPLGRHRKRNGLSYFPVDYYGRDPAEKFRAAMETVAEMAGFLEALEVCLGSRPLVTGISQGGDIALLLGAYHPDRIRAAVALAPVIPDALLDDASLPMPSAPIMVIQGDDDPIVAVGLTRAGVRRLQDRLSISVQTYRGVGHDISPRMKADYTRLIDEMLHGSRVSTGGRE